MVHEWTHRWRYCPPTSLNQFHLSLLWYPNLWPWSQELRPWDQWLSGGMWGLPLRSLIILLKIHLVFPKSFLLICGCIPPQNFPIYTMLEAAANVLESASERCVAGASLYPGHDLTLGQQLGIVVLQHICWLYDFLVQHLDGCFCDVRL